ncbi:MAG TPA: protein kinase [Polyangia bacterium]|nr:protein kinase [Polyangia bacterium]
MSERDFLTDADRAERAGDPMTAALALRRHLERHADDSPARLRFARLLITAGERAAARQALELLERQSERASASASVAPRSPSRQVDPREVERALAELDEAEGAIVAAAGRWQRLLADDIDDAQARAHLARLQPAAPSSLPLGNDRPGPSETLISPEGVETLRYRLMRELGRGATATVYLARDEALGLEVALKVLHPQLAGARQTEALARFFAGARLLAGLRHAGVVAVYDVDERARALAMEWVAGGTLRARLAAHPDGLPAAEVAATAQGLLATLAFLHGRGIVHGDLKPSNLLLRAPGEVVLADFGAATLIDREARAPRLAEAGGTPLYLAPEQLQGAAASSETDLYAAGAILWETAIGRSLRSHEDLLRRAPPAGTDTSGEARLREAHARVRARVPASAETILALLDPSPSARRPWGRARPSTNRD